MITAFFFYFKYKSIDFNKIIIYTKSDIFKPKKDEYYLLLFSSKMSDLKNLIKKIPKKYPILAINIFHKRKNFKNIIYTTVRINIIIKLIQYFILMILKIKSYLNKIAHFKC